MIQLSHYLEKTGVCGVNNALTGDWDPPNAVQRSLALLVRLMNISSVNKPAAFTISIPRQLDPKYLCHEASIGRGERDSARADSQADEKMSGGGG